MILDSILLVANSYILNHGELPSRLRIRRGQFMRLYHMSVVVNIACKVANLKKPPVVWDSNRIRGILHKAVCEIHKVRAKSPYKGLLKTPQVVPMNREGIIDLRFDTCNVSGMSRARLQSIIADNKLPVSPSQAAAAVELLRSAHLVIVNNEQESLLLQHFMAERAITAMVITSEKAAVLEMPDTTDEWSDPTVDHQ